MSEAGLLAFKKQVILNKNIFEGKNKWLEFKNTFDGWWSQGDQKAWVKSCPMSIKSCPKILLLDLMTLCQKAKNVGNLGNLGWKSIPQVVKICSNTKILPNLVTLVVSLPRSRIAPLGKMQIGGDFFLVQMDVNTSEKEMKRTRARKVDQLVLITYKDDWTVMVGVKWSACSPCTTTFRVRNFL